MDLVQASIGAAAAQSIGRTSPNCLLIGALGGFLLIPMCSFALQRPPAASGYHRHFTLLDLHSCGGLITAGIGQLLTRGRHRIAELWLPATLG